MSTNREGKLGTEEADSIVVNLIFDRNIASRLQSAFLARFQSTDSESSGKLREKIDMSAIYTSIQSWLDRLGHNREYTRHQDTTSIASESNEEEDDDTPLPNANNYTEIVFNSVAYRWLTASLRCMLSLAPAPGQEGTRAGSISKSYRLSK